MSGNLKLDSIGQIHTEPHVVHAEAEGELWLADFPDPEDSPIFLMSEVPRQGPPAQDRPWGGVR